MKNNTFRFLNRPNLTRYIIVLCCIIQAIQLTSAGCSHTPAVLPSRYT